MGSRLLSNFRPTRRETWKRIGFHYVAMIVGVELVVTLIYANMGLDRLLFELEISIVISSIVGIPIITLAAVQQERLQVLTEKLARLSATDQMTGLLNRQTFLDRLELHLVQNRDRPSAGVFAYIDGDHFKAINDRFGHAVGDRVILLIAEHIKGVVRSGDFMSRLGGEEFGVFLCDSNLEQGSRIADRLRREIEMSGLKLGIPGFGLSVSIGLVAHRRGESALTTMRNADRSLYAAKHSGRNAVVVELKQYRAA